MLTLRDLIFKCDNITADDTIIIFVENRMVKVAVLAIIMGECDYNMCFIKHFTFENRRLIVFI